MSPPGSVVSLLRCCASLSEPLTPSRTGKPAAIRRHRVSGMAPDPLGGILRLQGNEE